MARPIFTHELIDPDFSWLLSTFKENHPEYCAVEMGGLPIVMFKVTTEEVYKYASTPLLPEPATLTSQTDVQEKNEET
jgi:hypothetical protein